MRTECKICSGNLSEEVKVYKDGLVYTMCTCEICGVLQTLEHYHALSPDYVELEEIDFNGSEAWCLMDHKLHAYIELAKKLRRRGIDLKGKRCLDVGCGSGSFLEYLSKEGANCFGFDLSNAHVEHAKLSTSTVQRCETVDEYCRIIGDDNLRFDIITLWDVFEHVRTPQNLLYQLSKKLSPDGVIFLSVPAAGFSRLKISINKILGRKDHSYLIPWEHVFYYSPLGLRMLQRQANLVELDCYGITPYRRDISCKEIFRRIISTILNNRMLSPPQLGILMKLEDETS